MCEEVWLSQSSSCEDTIAAISLAVSVEQEECSLNAGDDVDRKLHHYEEVLRKMRDEIDKVNEYVDKEAEQFIEVAKEECKLIQYEIQKINDGGIKSVEEWLLISNKNEKQKAHFSKITNELATDLKSVEKFRAEEIEKILLNHKDEAAAVRFTSLEDIANLFEEEIENINLNMLKAFKRYEDVNVQLQVECQGILVKGQKHVKEKTKLVAEQEAQHLWKKVQEKQSRKLLNETIYNLSQEKFRVKKEYSELAKNLALGLSDFAEGLQLPTEYGPRGEYWEQWIESLNTRLASLDTHCKRIEMLLKSAVGALMESFDNQANEFSRTMGIQLNDHLNKFENKFDVSNEIEEFRKRQAMEINHLQENWQVTVDLLNSKIERSKNFVLDLTAVWTAHLARVNKLYNHIESTLESSYNSSLKKCKEQDTALKALVKSVREAKNVATLKEMCETLKDKFKEQVMDLENSYETQLETMEEMKLKGVEELIKEKQLHINNFLNNKYPKTEWFFYRRTSGSIGSIELSDSDFKIVSQIDLCNTYMTAVENRTLGLYEMLERYVPFCETHVKEETEEWMNMFIQDIVNSYDSQLNELNERQIKTLKDTEHIRFAEIQIHSRRLMSHINGAKHELSELSKWYDDVKTKQTASLKQFNEMVASRLTKDNLRGIKNVIMLLEQEWNCLSDTLTNSISKGKIQCEKKYANVKEASKLFLKTAKNFKNGGNYSPEELKTLNKELNQLGKFITAQSELIIQHFNNLAKLISRNFFDLKIEQINEEMKDLKLQHSIADTLSLLRMRLRSEINTMKSKIKSLEDKISFLASSKQVDTDLLNDILTLVRQTHDYMVFPKGVLSLECTEAGKSVDLTNPSTESNKTQQRNKSVVSKQNSDPLFKNTTDDVLSDEINFFTLTKGLILKKYHYLCLAIRGNNLVTASVAVKPKTTDSKQKATKQNVESDAATQHITLLKHVLRSYNSECELTWLSQAREFLDQSVTLRKIFNAVAELELNNNHENYIRNLNGLHREYVCSIKEGELTNEADRESIKRSLVLPLAHPANHSKLSELQEKARNLGQLQKDKYKTYLTKYKNDLQNKHDNYVNIVRTLKDRLSDLQTALFGEYCKILVDSLKDVKNVFPYEYTLKEEPLNVNPVHPLSIWSEGSDMGLDSQTPRSICVILLPTSSKTSNDSFSGGSGEAARASINTTAAEQVKESAQQVQKMYDRARDSTKLNEKTVQKWLECFEHHVKEAKLVYSWHCDS